MTDAGSHVGKPTSSAAVLSSKYDGAMADRVKVTEAARTIGVPGPDIFLAIRHGEISTVAMTAATTGSTQTKSPGSSRPSRKPVSGMTARTALDLIVDLNMVDETGLP